VNSVSGVVVLSDSSRSNVSLSRSSSTSCREPCSHETSQQSARDVTSTSIDLLSAGACARSVRERTYACVQAHYDPFAMHSGTHARALWPARPPYFRFVILTTCWKTEARRRKRAYTRMWNEVRHVFAQCCRRSLSRVLGIPLPIQGDASLTGWMRSDCRTRTASIGRKNMGAALRAVLASRRLVSTMALREGRRRSCAALTRTGGCSRQRFG
jgi:hypothetical protein